MNAIFEKKNYFQLRGTVINGPRVCGLMFHPHGELLYVQEGSADVTVDGVDYRLCAGDAAAMFPYLAHSYAIAPDTKAMILLFDPAATVFDRTLLEKKPVNCRVDGRGLCSMMERSVWMLRHKKRKTAIAYLNAVLGELLELLTLEERDSPAGDVTVQILSYCAEHFAEDITVKKVADALFISQSYVSKVFANKLKYDFREYINGLRIHKAQTMLRETDKKIFQIMDACGFRNQSSFNRVFRGITGVSPKVYRNIAKDPGFLE